MKKFALLFTLVGAMFASALFAAPVADELSTDLSTTALAIFGVSLAASFFAPVQMVGTLGALTYSPMEFKGPAYEEILYEVMYQNNTLKNGLVRFIDNVKTETIITEASATTTVAAYVENPSGSDSAGDVTIKDYITRPVQLMSYLEYSPSSFKYSRFGQNAAPTAFNNVTDEFHNLVLTENLGDLSYQMESQFWNGAKAATAVSVAALTPGTGQGSVGAAEQTYVAAAPVTLFDGIVTKLIYDRGAVGTRYKVAGTTLSSSNIATEMGKVYAAISPKLLQSGVVEGVKIFAPHAVKQFINIYNITATYRDLFAVQNGVYSYAGITIEFVPLPANCMIAGRASDLIWACDTTDVNNFVKSNVLANNSEKWFIKAVFTESAAVALPSQKVLYLG